MTDCNTNHTSKVLTKQECEVCGMTDCNMNHTSYSTNSSHMNMTS
ncbi:MAG: hypothetical protein Q8M97_11835 [Methanobacteriaceae archaeon]|nr:hypothetical protein [Methanobacteriaceae archaeon]